MAGPFNNSKEIKHVTAEKVNGVSDSIAVAAGTTPTKAEFDALVNEFNKLVAELKKK